MKNIMINKSVLYFATVTLLPKHYKLTLEEQYDSTYKVIYDIIKGLGTNVTITAEPTQCYNLHFHMILQYTNFKPKTNLIKKFHDAFRGSKIFGFVNISQVENLQLTTDYLFKSILQSRQDINYPPILCDELNLYSEGKDLFFHRLIRQDLNK